MKRTSRSWGLMLAIAAVVVAGAVWLGYRFWPRPAWTEAEVALLRSLWLGSLPPLPADPSNRFGDDPAAAALGEKLFFDTRLSINGQVACATCHVPQLGFQDGKPLSEGIGSTTRRAMPLAGTAYSPWFFWDGRKDSQWAQALAPLENPVEHGGDRTYYVHLLQAHYRSEYEAIFGSLPDLAQLPLHAGPDTDPNAAAAWAAMTTAEQEAINRAFANMGKAIAAFERQILPGASRFDQYVAALLAQDQAAMDVAMTEEEVAGLRLFISKADCTQCHNGPLLTDHHFHNTGVPLAPGLPEDLGRAVGAQQVLADEFNCLGVYSDAGPDGCAELRYMVADGHALVRQYKPPSLRNVAERAPYMHAGQFAQLAEVLQHYNRAPEAPAGHSELHALNLTPQELEQLAAFLESLSGPLVAPSATTALLP